MEHSGTQSNWAVGYLRHLGIWALLTFGHLGTWALEAVEALDLADSLWSSSELQEVPDRLNLYAFLNSNF